jgi:hypothetical protein
MNEHFHIPIRLIKAGKKSHSIDVALSYKTWGTSLIHQRIFGLYPIMNRELLCLKI